MDVSRTAPRVSQLRHRGGQQRLVGSSLLCARLGRVARALRRLGTACRAAPGAAPGASAGAALAPLALPRARAQLERRGDGGDEGADRLGRRLEELASIDPAQRELLRAAPFSDHLGREPDLLLRVVVLHSDRALPQGEHPRAARHLAERRHARDERHVVRLHPRGVVAVVPPHEEGGASPATARRAAGRVAHLRVVDGAAVKVAVMEERDHVVPRPHNHLLARR
mmetsp:Transcript_9514/g.31532  ORF Transcript_9514/g.31532 Transcript_9514/m.31532 type:complete len:225 (+) Transcript_9514:2-676(+)